MTSKGKIYREKRIETIRNCLIYLQDILIMGKKEQLDLIPLVFLKNLEKDLEKYRNTFIDASRISGKEGQNA